MCGLGRGHATGETMSLCFGSESSPYLLLGGRARLWAVLHHMLSTLGWACGGVLL